MKIFDNGYIYFLNKIKLKKEEEVVKKTILDFNKVNKSSKVNENGFLE